LPAAAAVGVVAACCVALLAYEALRHRAAGADDPEAVSEEPVPEYGDWSTSAGNLVIGTTVTSTANLRLMSRFH
jgi:hypothetical protein